MIGPFLLEGVFGAINDRGIDEHPPIAGGYAKMYLEGEYTNDLAAYVLYVDRRLSVKEVSCASQEEAEVAPCPSPQITANCPCE
jgi:hypothetical protein